MLTLFRKAIYWMVLGFSCIGLADETSSGTWFERLRIGMEVGPTGAQFGSDPSDVGYAARFSGREIVEAQIKAHSEYIVIWAKDSEYAYYNSQVAPKCPGLGNRDVLRETIDSAKPHGLPVIAYCVIQGNGYPLRNHPEYKMRDSSGNPIDRICLNSGFIEHAKALTMEMAAYGIDGFHIDMLDLGFGPPYGCWCETCKRLFRDEYKREMPPGVTWDEAWDCMMEFRYNTSARFERNLCESIRALNPHLTVDFNYHGSPPFSWEVGQRPVQHAVNADFVTGETGIWGFSALGVGLTAEFLAASTPGNPFQIAMQRGVRMYHDQTCRPLNDLRWELMMLLVHGAQVTVVDKTPYDGSLDPVTYDRIGKAFAEVHRKKVHFNGQPVQDVGIYYSSRSRDWFAKEEPFLYQQAFYGAHKALVYEHIPWGILLDENVTLPDLKRFPVVFLPNTAILSDREIGLFKQYVSEGGNLIATGFSGLFDRMGRPLEESSLSELIGAKLIGRLDSIDNHVSFKAAQKDWDILREGIPPDWPFLVKGPAVVFERVTAHPVGEVWRPHRTVRQKQGLEGTEWPMSADQAVGPALLIHPYGKGKVAFFACSPDSAVASEHGIPENRLMIRQIVRFLHPDPQVAIEAPLNVESVILDDTENHCLRVHLLGYLSPPACTPAKNRPAVIPALIEEEPLYRLRIQTKKPIRKVSACDSRTIIERISERRFEALVNNIHEVIVLEY